MYSVNTNRFQWAQSTGYTYGSNGMKCSQKVWKVKLKKWELHLVNQEDFWRVLSSG